MIAWSPTLPLTWSKSMNFITSKNRSWTNRLTLEENTQLFQRLIFSTTELPQCTTKSTWLTKWWKWRSLWNMWMTFQPPMFNICIYRLTLCLLCKLFWPALWVIWIWCLRKLQEWLWQKIMLFMLLRLCSWSLDSLWFWPVSSKSHIASSLWWKSSPNFRELTL
mgnify:CR=1 FL=1